MIRVLTLVAALAGGGEAGAACRQALALALDVSGSVNAREYRLQMQGLANALRHDEVVEALLAHPGLPVWIAIFEWSGPDYQRMLHDWQAIGNRATIERIANSLARRPRQPAPPGTALGTAMQYGAALLARRPDCWKRTLDISGDGKQNQGPHPQTVRDDLAAAGLTVNGLVIGADTNTIFDTRSEHIGELGAYFGAYVIAGPDAFVESALGYADYEAAMVRKLKRELQTLVVSGLPPPGVTGTGPTGAANNQ